MLQSFFAVGQSALPGSIIERNTAIKCTAQSGVEEKPSPTVRTAHFQKSNSVRWDSSVQWCLLTRIFRLLIPYKYRPSLSGVKPFEHWYSCTLYVRSTIRVSTNCRALHCVSSVTYHVLLHCHAHSRCVRNSLSLRTRVFRYILTPN